MRDGFHCDQLVPYVLGSLRLVSVGPSGGGVVPIKTLGPLKPPAYYKAADDGGLLVAIEAEQVIGYALFGLSIRSAHIRLAHLYVAEEQRGRSVARWLVGEIKEWYPQRLGIKAKCRCRSRHGRENVLVELPTSCEDAPVSQAEDICSFSCALDAASS